MPKHTIHFNLPEEKEELELAMKSLDNFLVVEGLDNFLRSKIKYGNLPEEVTTIYQEIRDKLWELRRDL